MALLQISHTLAGSRLYGTSRPGSDKDSTLILLPSRNDILLGKASWSSHTEDASGEDTHTHTLFALFHQLASGTHMSVEALFAPEFAHIIPEHPMFTSIRANPQDHIHPDLPKSVGFVYTMLKNLSPPFPHGRKVIHELIDTLPLRGPGGKVAYPPEPFFNAVQNIVRRHPEMLRIEENPGTPGLREKRIIYNLCVLNNKTHLHLPQKAIHSFLEAMLSHFPDPKTGYKPDNRARKSSHSIRIARQIHEYRTTGNIVFPRPDADELLKIRTGELPDVPFIEEALALMETIPKFNNEKLSEAILQISEKSILKFGNEIIANT